MAKARAILKRRKAVRNIKKITRTMQMIATAKFQKSLKRAVSTKPYAVKVRELVSELAASVGNVEHPLLRKPTAEDRTGRIAVIVLTSNRGLAGAYNGSVLRTADRFMKAAEQNGQTVELFINGKKGQSFFRFQGRPIEQAIAVSDEPKLAEIEQVTDQVMRRFTAGEFDSVHLVYMNFISTGVQMPDVLTVLPLAGAVEAVEALAEQFAQREDQLKRGALNESAAATAKIDAAEATGTVQYDFSPSPEELLNELLPLTVKTTIFQAFLDATTSEHVARMVAMKSASDNADKMGKALQLQYNRARQTQITTELSEIMGGVEAMNA